MTVIDEPLLQFDFVNADQVEHYRRQLETLYAVVEGTCPGDRHFGLSNEYQDELPAVAESTYSLEIYNKTEEYVPQVEIRDIKFEHGADGQLKPVILFGLNEDYDEDEEDDDD